MNNKISKSNAKIAEKQKELEKAEKESQKQYSNYTKRAKTDQSMKGIKKLYQENPEQANKLADEIIKNTYRTLMTRGMKGCYIYCVDKELREYLKKQVERNG